MDATLIRSSLPLGLVLAGFMSWGLLEYGIHGLLSHRLRTPVSPIHWGHHRTPAAVFTSPLAWAPIALILFVVAVLWLGAALGSAFMLGLLAGFARYEWMHWRFHFRTPTSERERQLRAHHLAHHFVDPSAYLGVTTRFWDRVFGSLPARWPHDYARVANRPPLPSPSNFGLIWNPRTSLAIVREAFRRAGGRS